MTHIAIIAAAIAVANISSKEPAKEMTPLDRQLIDAVASAESCEKPFSIFDEEERKEPVGPPPVKIIGDLIDSGANVNAQWPDGTTALMIAVQSNVQCAVDTLLARGADAGMKDAKGMTALMHACSYKGANQKIVYSLLQKHPNADEQSNSGSTALMYAASKGKIEAVKILLNFGADVDIKSKSGGTALSAAKGNEYKEIVKVLKKRGASK